MTYQEGDLLRQPDGSVFQLFGLDYTTFVYIEKGSFSMGNNNSGYKNEREVTIDFKEGYFMAQYTVTQELYERVMGGFTPRFEHKHRPVESVSWNDIGENNGFLERLNEQVQMQCPFLTNAFVLSSEAQWEYAARGGKAWETLKMTYAGSQDIEDVAWYQENGYEETMPVGLKQPNILGLFDMSGNVWEWCADIYTESYNRIPKDGSANLQPGSHRVLRGGSSFSREDFCRAAFRLRSFPDTRSETYGCRLVLPCFIH